jgi:hypothetical protein
MTPEREAALVRFWERYIEIIQNQGVTKPFDRWYVIRAQAYIDARPGLASQSTSGVGSDRLPQCARPKIGHERLAISSDCRGYTDSLGGHGGIRLGALF